VPTAPPPRQVRPSLTPQPSRTRSRAWTASPRAPRSRPPSWRTSPPALRGLRAAAPPLPAPARPRLQPAACFAVPTPPPPPPCRSPYASPYRTPPPVRAYVCREQRGVGDAQGRRPPARARALDDRRLQPHRRRSRGGARPPTRPPPFRPPAPSTRTLSGPQNGSSAHRPRRYCGCDGCVAQLRRRWFTTSRSGSRLSVGGEPPAARGRVVPPPLPRTNRTSLVPPLVLIGQVCCPELTAIRPVPGAADEQQVAAAAGFAARVHTHALQAPPPPLVLIGHAASLTPY
jgi:hypothetical protein